MCVLCVLLVWFLSFSFFLTFARSLIVVKIYQFSSSMVFFWHILRMINQIKSFIGFYRNRSLVFKSFFLQISNKTVDTTLFGEIIGSSKFLTAISSPNSKKDLNQTVKIIKTYCFCKLRQSTALIYTFSL